MENVKKNDGKVVDWTDFRKKGSISKSRSSDRQKVEIPSKQPNFKELTQSRPASSELRPGPGFRINSKYTRVPADLIAKLSKFETQDMSDALNRMFTMDPAIRNIVNDQILNGNALTVKVFPGDNLMVHKALDIAKPGDIIVIDTLATVI